MTSSTATVAAASSIVTLTAVHSCKRALNLQQKQRLESDAVAVEKFFVPLQPFSTPGVFSTSYRCFEPKQKMNNLFSTSSGVIA